MSTGNVRDEQCVPSIYGPSSVDDYWFDQGSERCEHQQSASSIKLNCSKLLLLLHRNGDVPCGLRIILNLDATGISQRAYKVYTRMSVRFCKIGREGYPRRDQRERPFCHRGPEAFHASPTIMHYQSQTPPNINSAASSIHTYVRSR